MKGVSVSDTSGDPAMATDAMDHLEVGRYWDRNADAWTTLSRAGYDVYRDLVNTPAFLTMLPDVAEASGLDVGCGEGHNTRLLAQRGAQMTGIDLAGRFLAAAMAEERRQPLGIRFIHASAASLPFSGAVFDFATAFMSLMDMPDPAVVLAEISRVLRPGGFLQCSIEHPCTATPTSGWVTDEQGARVGWRIGGYFSQTPYISTWLFGAAPEDARRGLPRFRIPRFPRTLSVWLNTIIATGLVIEEVGEPCADDAAIARYPKLAGARAAPLFLHLRCRKPASESRAAL
jgi:SAM-dependent methyltransferase